MNLITAIKNIKKENEVNLVSNDVAEIVVNKMLDDFNKYFVAIKEKNGNVYLTDYGKTSEILDLPDDVIFNICNDFNIKCNNYTLQCDYNSNEDLINFIKCIDTLKEKSK